MGYDNMIEIIEEGVDDIGSESTFPDEDEQSILLNHALMNNLDTPNQHPITAIIGLENKLAEIEKLDTVYSDKKNIADFYLWKDWNDKNTSPNRFGYFVSVCDEEVSKITLCTSGEPFGVVVDTAAFVGGQTKLDVTTDHRYALVAHSGIVTVRCEVGINVGDYVIPNEYGYAKKDENNCGYRVVARNNVGVEPNAIYYAVISFNNLTSRVSNIKSATVNNAQSIAKANESLIILNDKIAEAINLIASLEDRVKVLEERSDDVIDKTGIATLTYYNNNTSKTIVKTKSGSIGSAITFTLFSPSDLGWAAPDGYVFSHWVIEGKGNKLIGDTVTINIGENLMATSGWVSQNPDDEIKTTTLILHDEDGETFTYTTEEASPSIWVNASVNKIYFPIYSEVAYAGGDKIILGLSSDDDGTIGGSTDISSGDSKSLVAGNTYEYWVVQESNDEPTMVTFKVDGTDYEVETGTRWDAWVSENPSFFLAAEYIMCEKYERSYLCDAKGVKMKASDVITNGVYEFKYADYWYEVVLMKDGLELDTLTIGGSSSDTGKVITDVETKTIKLVSVDEVDVCYLAQLEEDNVVGLYVYHKEGAITDRTTEITVSANVENVLNVSWDINNNACTHPAGSIETEQYSDAQHLCRCTEQYCGYEWLEVHSYDNNGRCTVCGHVKPALCSCGNPLSECPSCGEIGWCSDCLRCESCGHDLNAKTFKIYKSESSDEVYGEYEYEEGMDWTEWVNSIYNTKPLYIVRYTKNGSERMHISPQTGSSSGLLDCVSNGFSLENVDWLINGEDKYDMSEVNGVSNVYVVAPTGSDGAAVKTFSIETQTHKFEEGMTWEDWVKSVYNVSGYFISNKKVCCYYGIDDILQFVCTSTSLDTKVSKDDKIIAGTKYERVDYNAGSGGSGGSSSGSTTNQVNFTIDGTSYSVPVGSTWTYFYNNGHTLLFDIDDNGYLHNASGDKWLVFSGTYGKCHMDDIISNTAYIFNELRNSD